MTLYCSFTHKYRKISNSILWQYRVILNPRIINEKYIYNASDIYYMRTWGLDAWDLIYINKNNKKRDAMLKKSLQEKEMGEKR